MFIFGKPYNDLLDKYLHCEFHSKEEENEYLNHLIEIINDNSLCFNAKIAVLNFMISGVNAGIVPPENVRISKISAS